MVSLFMSLWAYVFCLGLIVRAWSCLVWLAVWVAVELRPIFSNPMQYISIFDTKKKIDLMMGHHSLSAQNVYTSGL